MKVFSPFLNGNTTTSGSLTLPRHPISSSITNPNTGSIYHDTTDNVVKVYTGNAWETVGAQTAPSSGLASANIEYLVVAGGGGGGDSTNATTGGGGAGGLLSSSLASVVSGSSFTVTIGAAGAIDNTGGDSSIAGTTISTITALGGGQGSGEYLNVEPAGNGGSGGGGGNGGSAGGSGTVGQGNDGGDSLYGGRGAGGGGAGAAGSNSPSDSGGNGGDGLQSNITGTATYYAGGGGGAGSSGAGVAGTGGQGGGGNGEYRNTGNATAGTANTGGGGGGAFTAGATSGGSGVAIFAYPSASINGAGGIVGDAGNGRKYNQFNSSSTLKIGSTSDFQIHTSNLVMHVDAGNFASRNGNTSGIDLSGYGNDLDLTGQSGGSLSDSFWWEGRSGGIADFDRNGVSSASNVAHTGYGAFTGRTNLGFCIDFWIKTTASGGWASGGKTIIGRNSSDLYGSISIFSNKLAWIHYDGSWSQEQSTTSINDGSWHHCVLNNNSNETIDIWVDGTKENNGAASAINPDTRYFKMDSLGRGYNGENTDMDIGQIRVYDTSLTDAQILQNYNATKTNFT